MQNVHILLVAALVAGATTGCAPVLKAPIGNEGTERAADQLDHGYALLHGLLTDEARVADILRIKNPYEETASILKSISETAKNGLEMIDASASEPPVIVLAETGLPLIETDARNRIANTVTMGLVLSMGTSFEVQMLLSQEKACGYAAALCESLATADPNNARAAKVGDLGKTFSELGERVRKRLTVVVPEKKPDDTNG